MRAFLLAGAGVLLLAGCGGGEGPRTVTVVETTTAPASTSAAAPATDARADRALARGALLQLSDLPVGWTATSEDDPDRIDCAAFVAARRMPRAASPDFAHGDEQFASHAVAVYPTSADADAALSELISANTRTCLGDELKRQLADRTEGEAEIGEVTVSELNVEPLGQRSAGLRVHVPISASGVDVDVYGDYVFGQVDRGLTMLSVGSTYVEPDEELQTTLAKRAVQRLGEALGRA
jgi:hypothetical protein